MIRAMLDANGYCPECGRDYYTGVDDVTPIYCTADDCPCPVCYGNGNEGGASAADCDSCNGTGMDACTTENCTAPAITWRGDVRYCDGCAERYDIRFGAGVAPTLTEG